MTSKHWKVVSLAHKIIRFCTSFRIHHLLGLKLETVGFHRHFPMYMDGIFFLQLFHVKQPGTVAWGCSLTINNGLYLFLILRLCTFGWIKEVLWKSTKEILFFTSRARSSQSEKEFHQWSKFVSNIVNPPWSKWNNWPRSIVLLH